MTHFFACLNPINMYANLSASDTEQASEQRVPFYSPDRHGYGLSDHKETLFAE